MSTERTDRAKRARVCTDTEDEVSSAEQTSIVDLPEELLHKILGAGGLELERWTALASVCKLWRQTLKRLVIIYTSLVYVEHFGHKIGSIDAPMLCQELSRSLYAQLEIGRHLWLHLGCLPCNLQ